jgi:hypothetical protein
MSHHDVSGVPDDMVPENPGVDFESKDLNIKAIIWFGASLLIVIIVAMVLIWGMMATMNSGTATTRPSALEAPPAPRLQPNPIDQTTSLEELMHQEMANQAEWLNSYGWVDKAAGVAHMPIDEAMKLTVEKYQ